MSEDYRVCLDVRPLNVKNRSKQFTLPKISDIIKKATKATMMATILASRKAGGENSNVRVKDKSKTKQVDFLLIKTGKNSALLYGNFSTGKWDLWDFRIMGFGNYGI